MALLLVPQCGICIIQNKQWGFVPVSFHNISMCNQMVTSEIRE